MYQPPQRFLNSIQTWEICCNNVPHWSFSIPARVIVISQSNLLAIYLPHPLTYISFPWQYWHHRPSPLPYQQHWLSLSPLANITAVFKHQCTQNHIQTPACASPFVTCSFQQYWAVRKHWCANQLGTQAPSKILVLSLQCNPLFLWKMENFIIVLSSVIICHIDFKMVVVNILWHLYCW